MARIRRWNEARVVGRPHMPVRLHREAADQHVVDAVVAIGLDPGDLQPLSHRPQQVQRLDPGETSSASSLRRLMSPHPPGQVRLAQAAVSADRSDQLFQNSSPSLGTSSTLRLWRR